MVNNMMTQKQTVTERVSGGGGGANRTVLSYLGDQIVFSCDL